MHSSTLVSGSSDCVALCMPTMHDATHASGAPPRAVLRVHAPHDATHLARTATRVALFMTVTGTCPGSLDAAVRRRRGSMSP
jgi:hypothetical protein